MISAMADDFLRTDASALADKGAARRWLIEAWGHRAATGLTVQRLRIETAAECRTW